MLRSTLLISLALHIAVPLNAQDSQPARPRPRIAVVPKGTTHVFWKSVEAGAKQAGEELGAEIIWKGPLKENDRAGQIQVVHQFVAQRIEGIVLAPLDHKALGGAVKAAADKKIPVVIFDSALEGSAGKDFASLVATNNHTGGTLAGAEVARLLGEKGKVVVLRYQVGSASTDEREKGCLEMLKKSTGISIISDNRYAGATTGEAKTMALNMIDDIRKADAVFCPNESSTQGMLLALQQVGLAGKIKFVGFDASPPLIEALKKGEIHALVVQNPKRMGYLAVKTVLQAIRNEAVEPSIDTGCALVTRENLDTPEIQALLD